MRTRGSTWNKVDDDQAAWMVRSGGLAQVLFERIACGCTARGDLDFPIDRLQVGVDCSRTDDELCGDLGVGQSLSQQAQHLHFARCQPVRIGGWRFRWRGWMCWLAISLAGLDVSLVGSSLVLELPGLAPMSCHVPRPTPPQRLAHPVGHVR